MFFDALSETLPMTVYSVGEIQNGEMVVVFRSSQNDSKVEDLRQESGRLIFQSDEGLRIPKEALRVNEDGETGVYVVLAQKARLPAGDRAGRGYGQLPGAGQPHR